MTDLERDTAVKYVGSEALCTKAAEGALVCCGKEMQTKVPAFAFFGLNPNLFRREAE